jgi:PAS domain S-box-containing protein
MTLIMSAHAIQVLVVDDEADFCTLTKNFLEMSEGIEVDILYTVSEAMAQLAKKRYDVIVSDYQMPGLDGLQFLKSLREAGKTTPFILFTGKGREEVVIEAMNHGADSYLQKGGKTVPQYAELEHRIRTVVQRHRAEESLRISEEKYKKVFFANHDSICITRLSDGRFVSVNNGFAEMSGYKAEEIIGKTSLEINIWKDPEDRRKIVEGLLAKGEVKDYEARFLTKNGEIYGSMSASIIELNGEPHILNVTRDITERKWAEETLWRMAVRKDAILAAIPDIMVEVDDQKRITWVNQPGLQFYGEDVIGHEASYYFVGEQRTYDSVQPLFDGSDEVIRLESWQRRKDGEKRLLSWRCKTLKDEEGRVTGVLSSARDITERKRAENEREVLREIGGSINTYESLMEILRTIHENIKKVMYAENCFIALHDPSTGNMSFPFFLDQFDPKPPSRTNQRGLTEYVFKTAKPLLLTPVIFDELVRQNEVEIIGTPPKSWLGVPLSIQSKPIGVLVVQSYEPGNDYTDTQRDLLVAIGNQAAEVIERKRAEDALQQSEKRYRLLVNSATEAIIVAQDGMLRLVNPVTVAILGLSEQELVSKPFLGFIHPDDRAMVFENYQRRMSGEVVPDRYAFRIQAKDGSVKWVEISAVTIDWEGRPATLNFLTEITERRRIEEALQESLQRYELVMDGSSAGLWDWDVVKERIHFSSRWKAMRGYTDDEIGDRLTEWSSRLHPDDAPRIMAAVQAHFEGRTQVYEEEYRVLCKDGSFKWILDRGKAVRDDNGRIIRMAGSEINITERKLAEDALRQANVKLGILNSITRHDINNQMTVISGFLELSKKREKDPELARYLERMSRAAANVQGQIAFTRDYQELGIKAPVWTAFGRQAANALAMLHPSGVALEDWTNGIEVLADPLAEKVFFNLIDNSIRHGGRVTRIKISAEQVADATTITYEDDGVGISAEDKKGLFEKGLGKNTGYGLFLIREILAITGITIVETGQAGKGARFEMLVPPGAWRRT